MIDVWIHLRQATNVAHTFASGSILGGEQMNWSFSSVCCWQNVLVDAPHDVASTLSRMPAAARDVWEAQGSGGRFPDWMAAVSGLKRRSSETVGE